MTIDNTNANTGAISASALAFGNASGEGIASKRNAGGNQFGLDFYTNSTNRMVIQGNGNVGIGTTAPGTKFVVNGGLTTLSRSTVAECCSGGDATLALADAPGSGQRASISFHNSGESEGKLQLIQNNVASVNTTSRRLQLLDNQSQGLGLEMSGGLFYGNSNSRTQTRTNAGLRGDAGAQSGFYENDGGTVTNFPAGSSSWQHLLDVRHNNPANNYAMQMAGSFFDQDVYVRKTNDNAATAWARVNTSRDLAFSQDRNTYAHNNANSGYRTTGAITNAISVKSGDVITIEHTSKFRWTGGSGGDHPFYGIAITGCAATNVRDFERIGTADDLPRGQWQVIASNYVWVATCNGTVQFQLEVDNNSDADDNSEYRDIVIIARRN